jgi:hypothetical protein
MFSWLFYRQLLEKDIMVCIIINLKLFLQEAILLAIELA